MSGTRDGAPFRASGCCPLISGGCSFLRGYSPGRLRTPFRFEAGRLSGFIERRFRVGYFALAAPVVSPSEWHGDSVRTLPMDRVSSGDRLIGDEVDAFRGARGACSPVHGPRKHNLTVYDHRLAASEPTPQ